MPSGWQVEDLPVVVYLQRMHAHSSVILLGGGNTWRTFKHYSLLAFHSPPPRFLLITDLFFVSIRVELVIEWVAHKPVGGVVLHIKASCLQSVSVSSAVTSSPMPKRWLVAWAYDEPRACCFLCPGFIDQLFCFIIPSPLPPIITTLHGDTQPLSVSIFCRGTMPHNVNWSRRLYRDVWACWTPCFLGKGKKEWKTGKKRAHESITPTGAPQAWHLHAVPAFGVYAPALRSLKNSISERGTQALSFDGWFSIHFQMDAGLSLRMDLAWKTQRMESDKSFMLYILTAVKSVKYAIDWGRGSRACQGLYWTAAFYWSQSLHPHYGQKRNCQFVCFFYIYFMHALGHINSPIYIWT